MLRPRSLTTDELLDAIRLWVAAKYPSYTPMRVTLEMERAGRQERVRLPIPAFGESTPVREDAEDTALQQGILEALDGTALRSRELDLEIKANGRLYKKGGLTELMEQGRVLSDRRVGYYRPDRPPENLPADLR